MIRLAIVALHADVPSRAESWERTMATLWPQCVEYDVRLYPYTDKELTGCAPAFYKAMPPILETSATHVALVPDDATYCQHFVRSLLSVIYAKPDEVICCLINHPDAHTLPKDARWYTTTDAWVGIGGVMRRELWLEALEWSELRAMRERTTFDSCINQWAMANGRKIYKPLPPLLDHDESIPSLTPPKGRPEIEPVIEHSVGFDKDRGLWGIDWEQGRVVDLGPTYRKKRQA